MTTHKDSYTADDLVDVLNRVQASAQPIDMASGDDDARIPAALWREFVDAHAALLHERAQRTALNPRAAWPFPEKREHGPNGDVENLSLLLSYANQDLEAMASHIFDLELALRKVIEASDQFVRDTGLKHGDLITDAVEWARGKITPPTATSGE